MDEPFSALDVQTRQLMENELLELWAPNRKSVLFITHDLEEAIALSDRVVVLSAGPGDAADRRVRDRPAAAARRRRDPHDAALRRAARGDLARAAGRSAEGLCAAAASAETRARAGARLPRAAGCGAVFALSGTLLTDARPRRRRQFAKNDGVLLRRAAQGARRSSGTGSSSGKIYPHLAVTLLETLLAFVDRQRARPGRRAVARAVAARAARSPIPTSRR